MSVRNFACLKPPTSRRRFPETTTAARLCLHLNAKAGEAGMLSPRTCRECGATFTARRASADFCSAHCRVAWNNRRLRRGGQLYDLVMAWRFNRTEFAAAGAQSLLCRMAAAFKADDDRDRAGRQSWDDVAEFVNGMHISVQPLSASMSPAFGKRVPQNETWRQAQKAEFRCDRRAAPGAI